MKKCTKCNADLFDTCESCGVCGNNDLIQTTVQPKTVVEEKETKDFTHPMARFGQYDNILVIGTSGSGKTSLAEKLKKEIKKPCYIYDEPQMLAKYGYTGFYETSKKLGYNNQKGIMNIITTPTVDKIPKAIRGSTNLVMFTQLSNEMATHVPQEYKNHRAIISSFNKQQHENNNGIRKYLAISISGAWIGEWKLND